MNNIIIEVCCTSAEDAIRAFKAGADRVELNCDMDAGGLTPTVGSLIEVKNSCTGPVICMLRPRAGGFCYTDTEYSVMKRDAKMLMEAGADGIAFGFLTAEGHIDVNRCQEMVDLIGAGEAVFHRAFDSVTGDKVKAMSILAMCGVTRVLTSGGEPTAKEGADIIRKCVDEFSGKIQVLAGGGVRPHNVKEIVESTGCKQVHFTCNKEIPDVESAKSLLSFDSSPSALNNTLKVLDEEKLQGFIKIIREI